MVTSPQTLTIVQPSLKPSLSLSPSAPPPTPPSRSTPLCLSEPLPRERRRPPRPRYCGEHVRVRNAKVGCRLESGKKKDALSVPFPAGLLMKQNTGTRNVRHTRCPLPFLLLLLLHPLRLFGSTSSSPRSPAGPQL